MSRLDQVAWHAIGKGEAEKLKIILGLASEPWIEDIVTGKSLFPDGKWCINKALLRFNYSQGIELEILTYFEGRHWHQNNSHFVGGKEFFISHVGYHLDDGEDFPEMPADSLVQETFTVSHTSEYLTTGAAAGRKYHYKIFELSSGNYVKYIRRLHPGKAEA